MQNSLVDALLTRLLNGASLTKASVLFGKRWLKRIDRGELREFSWKNSNERIRERERMYVENEHRRFRRATERIRLRGWLGAKAENREKCWLIVCLSSLWFVFGLRRGLNSGGQHHPLLFTLSLSLLSLSSSLSKTLPAPRQCCTQAIEKSKQLASPSWLVGSVLLPVFSEERKRI